MAIDYIDAEYHVSLLMYKQIDKDMEIEIINESGKSIKQIIQTLETKNTKKITLSHLSLVIVSEELATEGIADIIDFFLHSDSQNFYLLVGKDELLPFTKQIVDKIASSEKQYKANFKDFIRRFYTQGLEPVTNGVRLHHGHIEITDLAFFKDARLISWQGSE